MQWITGNIADIGIVALIVAICAAIVVYEIKKRKHILEERGCAGNCAYCSGCSTHKEHKTKVHDKKA